MLQTQTEIQIQTKEQINILMLIQAPDITNQSNSKISKGAKGNTNAFVSISFVFSCGSVNNWSGGFKVSHIFAAENLSLCLS